MFDLNIPENSYIFGFLQADGHMCQSTRNRGRISIELSKKDVHILEDISKLLPVTSSLKYRTRDTNFKAGYESCVLTICDWDFRTKLESLGLPYGKKHDIIGLPTTEFVKFDYIRGLIDGDGSVGFTKPGRPFISLNTSSEEVANFYKKFVKEVTGKDCNQNRNKRDNSFNIMHNKEDAQKLCKLIYYENCLALKRKLTKSQEILAWIRPSDMIKREPSKKWDKEQDQFILSNSIEDSMNKLGRTKHSIKVRLWRLKSSKA